MAGGPLRRQKAGVHGRERIPCLHDASEVEGSQGEAGVWQGPEEPGQEPDLDRLDHPGGRDGRAELLFLPSYSPDLNPMEEAFSKVKNIVRKAGARTREALNEAMGEALSAVTSEDVAGWFSHCGYEPRDQYS